MEIGKGNGELQNREMEILNWENGVNQKQILNSDCIQCNLMKDKFSSVKISY